MDLRNNEDAGDLRESWQAGASEAHNEAREDRRVARFAVLVALRAKWSLQGHKPDTRCEQGCGEELTSANLSPIRWGWVCLDCADA